MFKIFRRIDEPPVRIFTKIEEQQNIMPVLYNTNTQVNSNTYYNDIIILNHIPEYDIQDYDIYDEKSFKKYVEDIKRVVRSSIEYRRFVNYLRENMSMDRCAFLQNVSNNDTFKIRIELHHSPFTLHDIVLTIFNKRLFYGESLEVEMVAKEVMYIHYYLLVGIIPLAETVHELVHEQYLFIPLDKVMGNYEEFITAYGEWIPEEVMDKIKAMKQRTLTYDAKYEMSILQMNPLALKLPDTPPDGLYNIPALEDIETMICKRICELKDNQKKQISAKSQ